MLNYDAAKSIVVIDKKPKNQTQYFHYFHYSDRMTWVRQICDNLLNYVNNVKFKPKITITLKLTLKLR